MMLQYSEKAAPLRKRVTQEEVGGAALFLASDLGSAVTGEVMHVDAGFNILGMTLTEEDLASLESV
jgi:enoyl-[acyl-carrier protein] reductase I